MLTLVNPNCIFFYKLLMPNYDWPKSSTSLFMLGHSNLITCLTSFFWKKNPVRLQKKKEKSRIWCLTDESGLKIFCQTPKKKKKKVLDLRIFIVRVIQSTSGVNNAVVEPHI